MGENARRSDFKTLAEVYEEDVACYELRDQCG